MANWNEKINAAQELREVIDEKDNLMDVYLTLKNVIETKTGLSNFCKVMNDESALENHFDIEDVKAKTSSETSNEMKAKEYIVKLSKTAEEVGEHYLSLMDEWLETVEEEGHNQKNYKDIQKALDMDGNEEFTVMEKVIKYKKKLPKMWTTYEMLKEEKGEEVDGDDLHKLDEDLDEVLNFLNDEKYDSDKAYV